MKIEQYPFTAINWQKVKKVRHAGQKGYALWQTIMMGVIRIRMVEYSAGYIADHWCHQGHVIYCTKGKMKTELEDGTKRILRKGMSYHVGDDSMGHRSSSKKSCKLFIVD